MEAVFLLLAEAKPFDDVDAAEVFRQGEDQAVVEFAVAAIGGFDEFGEGRGSEPEQRGGGQTGQGELGTDAHHVDKIDADREAEHDDLQHDTTDEVGVHLHIPRHAIDDRAAVIGIIEAEAEALKLVIDRSPHVHHQAALNQAIEGQGVGDRQDSPEDRERKDQRAHRDDLLWGRPGGRGGDPQREMRRRHGVGGGGMPDDVHAQAREPKAEQAQDEKKNLDEQREDACPAIVPCGA